MKHTRAVEYSDELKDEFSGIKRDTITIDGNYKYIHKRICWRAASFLLYRVIMTPIAWLYMKWKFCMRIVNREAVRVCRKQGYFLYGNHTQIPGDGYIPTLITFPKQDIVIVNADNLSLKGTKTFMEMIGAYPLPDDIPAMKNFINGLEYWTRRKKSIVIYPEAHIWPYYTKIRPFGAASFAYPVKFHKPVYCFTVTYQRRRRGNQPKITVYVDGPFYPEAGLDKKEAQQNLREQVYETMKARSKLSDYEYIIYRKKEAEQG